jgi:ATP-dependent Lhr-like helicase
LLYGAMLPWPKNEAENQKKLARVNGAEAILVDGALVAYVHRGGRSVSSFLTADEPDRARVARAVAEALSALSHGKKTDGLLLTEIDGVAASAHPLAPFLLEAGFAASSLGYYVRRHPSPVAHA